MTAPTPLTAPNITARHGFFGRAGGVSTGVYRGLNCGFGSDDEEQNVATNRARVAETMGIAPDHLLTVYQIHSPDVLTVATAHSFDAVPKGDAMVTTTRGLGLAILTADCAPILLCDKDAGVIGAAHAGWRGAFGGILENTIAAMKALGATNIRAAIGPTISQENYEVDDKFRDTFLADDERNDRFFVAGARPGHCQFDLPAYCAARLEAAGVSDIIDTAVCTYADEDQFFSYRRATHRGEPDYGRNISVIVLSP